MEKIKNDAQFIALLEKFLPKNYRKLSIDEKKEIITKFENYAAIIQERSKMDIVFHGEGYESGRVDLDNNTVYINEKMISSSLSVIETILHEGYHFVSRNAKNYPHLFSEEEIELLEINYTESQYFNYGLGYYDAIFEKNGFRNYLYQPCEYYSFKESYLKTSEIVSFMEEKFNQKGLLRSYNQHYRLHNLFNPNKIFSDEFYNSNVKPIQLELMDNVIKRIEHDKQLIAELKSKAYDKVMEITFFSSGVEDVSSFFFPLAWEQLTENNKAYIVEAYCSQFGIKLSEEYYDKFASMEGPVAFESIQREVTNAMIKYKCGLSEDFDFIEDVKDFAFSYDRFEPIKKGVVSILMEGKDYNKLYPFDEIGRAFFVLPAYNYIKEYYVNNVLSTINKMVEVYGYSVYDFKGIDEIRRVCLFLDEPMKKHEKIMEAVEKIASRM